MKNYLIRVIEQAQLEPAWNYENIAALTAEAQRCAELPFSINESDYVRVSECTISTMVHSMPESIVVVNHNGFQHPVPEREDPALYKEYSKAMLYRLVLGGIMFNGEKYDFYTATAADLKSGKARFIRHSIKANKAKELMFMRNPHELSSWSANEECKVKATLFTGCEALQNSIGVEEVLIVKSIDFANFFGDTLSMSADGKLSIKKNHSQSVTHFDGQMLILKRFDDNLGIPPAGQGRIGNLKLTWTVVEMSMLRARARHWGTKLPRTIKDYWGNERELKNIRAICTEDCVKGLKWFSSFEDLCNSLKAMGVSNLRMCRRAEESAPKKRDLSRQALQELIFASEDDLKQLSANAAEELVKLNTVDGQLENAKKTSLAYSADVLEAYPEILSNKDVYENSKRQWELLFNKRMVTPMIAGSHYEQIEEDPWAFVDIVFFNVAPGKAGVLKRGECFCSAKNRALVYGIRHPANLLNGRILVCNKTPWLKSFENISIFILPVNDITLTGYWDGDVDGDECFWSTNMKLIALMKRTIDKMNPLPFVFPHDKAVKGKYPNSRQEWAKEMSLLLFNGVEYNLVGKYSNLATKLLTELRMNQSTSVQNQIIYSAAYAHAMSILCLDFVKTGKLPKEIMAKADVLNTKHVLMPFNQKFMKFKQGFKGDTLSKSNCVVDRYGDALVSLVGTDKFEVKADAFNYDGNMLTNGTKTKFYPTKKTELFEIWLETASLKTKDVNTVEFDEVLMTCFKLISKHSADLSKSDVKDMFDRCRKLIVKFTRLPENSRVSNGLSDKECLRWAANRAWIKYDTAYKLRKENENKNNQSHYVMFLLNMFGDIYAENVLRNMAPDNNINEVVVHNPFVATTIKPANEMTQAELNAYCEAGNHK